MFTLSCVGAIAFALIAALALVGVQVQWVDGVREQNLDMSALMNSFPRYSKKFLSRNAMNNIRKFSNKNPVSDAAWTARRPSARATCRPSATTAGPAPSGASASVGIYSDKYKFDTILAKFDTNLPKFLFLGAESNRFQDCGLGLFFSLFYNGFLCPINFPDSQCSAKCSGGGQCIGGICMCSSG
jgi:hypothetical protein